MTDEARLQRWIDSHREGGGQLSTAHIDIDTLMRHASNQLSPNDTRLVLEHLQVCEDGRCPDFVRSHTADPEASSDWIQTSEAQPIADARSRTFRSREIVWSTFESMARELEVPIDELVNEAMAAYAQARGYATGQAGQAAPPPNHARPAQAQQGRRDRFEESPQMRGSALDDVDDLARTAARPAMSRPPAGAGRPPANPPSSRSGMPRNDLQAPTLDRPIMPRPPPSRPPVRPSGGLPPVPQPPSRVPMPPMTQRLPDARGGPPPLTGGGGRGIASPPASTRHLVLEYQGKTYPVEKERFLIGRSKTQADLRLDDPNVSRQHAVIERVGAAWYIVDLGSTNGVQIAGERVARRALTDADLIVITTHEIRCALR